MTTEDLIALVIEMKVSLTTNDFMPAEISSLIERFHASGKVPIVATLAS